MHDTSHHIPLRTPGPRLAAGAGVLRGAARVARPAPRYAPLRRARRDVPRLFVLSSGDDARGCERGGVRRALEYRRPAAGFPPFTFHRDPPRVSLQRCPSRLSLTSILSTDAPIPQFARDDIDDKSDSRSVRKRLSSSVSYKEKEKVIESVANAKLERKILNTERYNNGARAPLLRRKRSERTSAACGAQRATVRAVLASSALFYALAFISFYFLSLA